MSARIPSVFIWLREKEMREKKNNRKKKESKVPQINAQGPVKVVRFALNLQCQ